jgi:hypothetical protein
MSNFDPPPMIIHGKNPYSPMNPDKPTISTKTVSTKTANSNKPSVNGASLEKKIDEGLIGSPEVISKDIASKISSTRIEKGFKTQKELSLKCNLTQTEINQMEGGKMPLTTANKIKIRSVMRVLGLTGKL